jgi:hypothetical protein
LRQNVAIHRDTPWHTISGVALLFGGATLTWNTVFPIKRRPESPEYQTDFTPHTPIEARTPKKCFSQRHGPGLSCHAPLKSRTLHTRHCCTLTRSVRANSLVHVRIAFGRPAASRSPKCAGIWNEAVLASQTSR